MRNLIALAVLLPFSAAASPFSDACSIVERQHGLTCDGVPAPEVVTIDDPELPLGAYVGGSKVYVQAELRGRGRELVLVHEITHYILSVLKVYPIPGELTDRCASEKAAFAVVDEFLRKQGVRRRDRTSWLDAYPQCKEVIE